MTLVTSKRGYRSFFKGLEGGSRGVMSAFWLMRTVLNHNVKVECRSI